MNEKKTPAPEPLDPRIVMHRRILGALLLPLALLPFFSIVTYDWHDISWLAQPVQSPPANAVGALGAWFTFIGYSVIGLALWLIPLWIIACCGMLIYGRTVRLGRRSLWLIVMILLAACLFQLHRDAFYMTLERRNLLPNAGGAVGQVLVSNVLEHTLSRVGSLVVIWTAFAFSVVFFIGFRNLVTGVVRLCGWFSDRRAQRDLYASEKEKENREAGRDLLRQSREAPRSPNPPPVPEKAPPPAPAPRPAPKPKAAPAPVPAPVAQPAGEKAFSLPTTALLDPIPAEQRVEAGNTREAAERIISTLREFKIEAEVTHIESGPVITQYELLPAVGVKVERIQNIAANLRMALSAASMRIQAPIPGKGVVGIEVPNPVARTVTLREVMEGETWKRNQRMAVPLALGKDASGNDLVADLAKMPHLLVAGSTGSGKSVCLNAILAGLLMSRAPDELRLILVDPKRVEFTAYDNLPHLLVPVVTDAKKVAFALRWALIEMDRRYKMLQACRVRNIISFNTRHEPVQQALFDGIGEEKAADGYPVRLPYIVIVLDEVADLMMQVGAEIEQSIARLTQLARAVGIHLILATQRPTVNVITGTIKSNIPGRIAFKVAQRNDSRTILDSQGAENLIGRGDMLFLNPTNNLLIRSQGAWVSDEEIERITEHIKAQAGPAFDMAFAAKMEKIREDEPEDALHDAAAAVSGGKLDPDEDDDATPAGTTIDPDDTSDDALVARSIEIIRETGRFSVSFLQRRLRLGYNKAGRIADLLEERGIIGPANGSNAREILVDLSAEIPSHYAGTDADPTVGNGDDDDFPPASDDDPDASSEAPAP